MLPYDHLAAFRLGYGLSPHLTPPADPQAVAASVQASTSLAPGDVTQDQLRDWQIEGQELNRNRRKEMPGADEAFRAHRQQMNGIFRGTIVQRFARAVDDSSGFGERLVWFWADHFTVAGRNHYTNLMTEALISDAIRPHLTGRFAQMMFAAETHPAMLTYLDQTRAMGPNSIQARRNPDRAGGLNENLAREMIELHSLGAGADYDQQDIEQLAELLTGLTYSPRQPSIFQRQRAEPGAETVLGTSYGGRKGSLDDIRAVIDDLAVHPATAAHLARKMAVHFVADDPPQALVDRLAGVFAETGGDLGAMNLALAEAPELATHFRVKMRQPFEFLVAGMRSLGMDGAQIRDLPPRKVGLHLIQSMAIMGQPWASPPGPDGWPEAAESWASPQGLAMRINWALAAPAALVGRLPDARRFLHSCLGDTASETLAWAVPRAESQADGVALILASADFNRR
ncbi:DUF1800 domain-containing protein [Paracoccus liaowanqingii]|uniref:DUF1800 domain-containing protein n=1 Tax=Paracoccus liaowanqingii TaxID=2560053 RepID=A0A4Z1BYQ4_9RHOB|nr:DUF1800 domain-containing protein [Paracoccus liaowanqingii]TGN57282.1 DUF1800 domain-containing protein [Paracoccus liaowanqingii]